MFDYQYTREQIEGDGYNINNNARVDEYGNPIPLAKEIEAVFINDRFRVICHDLTCTIEFERELSSSEKLELDAIVQAHKDNT